MVKVIAGHKGFSVEVDSVLEEWELPGHVQVTTVPDDFESYGESELSDAELLAVAASDAVDAVEAGELAFAEVDELALRRVLRTAREQQGGALEVIA
jgi:hypothetical protein